MECNKDEAMRAKEIAEKKFEAKDYAGAKKFALKAQNLYPGLEGLPQMLATFDVYMCDLNKANGEADWYGILGIAPSADDETVRQQYRKLALMLHPDKNKSNGAEGAFKLISEAWSFLSDKSKRASYDQRRSSRAFHQKAKPPGQDPKAPSRAHGFYEFAKSTVSDGRVNKNTSQANKSSVSGGTQKAKPDTFWTVCHKCKMQYEYLRVYLNKHLLCPNCQQPFYARETPSPVSNGLKTYPSWNSSKQQRNSGVKSASETRSSNSMSGAFGNNSGVKSASETRSSNSMSGAFGNPIGAASYWWTPSSQGGVSNVADAANVFQQAYEKVKREREEALAAQRRDKDLKRKNHAPEKMPGASSTEHLNFAKKRRDAEEPGGYSDTIQVKTINKRDGVRGLSQIEIRAILMEKARTFIHKKIEDKSNRMSLSNDATLREKAVEEAQNEDKRMKHRDVFNQKECETSVGRKNGMLTDNGSPAAAAAAAELGEETSESLTISVPDPDFYDFDKDRTERSFEENQVWAAYDNDDGMPRYYAIIDAVLSRNPFKVRICWLEPNTSTELGSLDWVGSGFSKTYGDFRVGRYEVNDSLNSFSHVITWTKATRGAICVFPRKGDVWALYQNWSPDWNELTPDDIIHKYDLVEVIEDYDEELGIAVSQLVKVAGFKAVFRQNLDHNQIKRIPKEEIFRFSHQVPSHLLTPEEASDTLKGCMELDPAATPLDLLHVIADVEDDAEKGETFEENLAETEKKESDKDLKRDVGTHEVVGNSKEEKVAEIFEID